MLTAFACGYFLTAALNLLLEKRYKWDLACFLLALMNLVIIM